MNTTYRIDICLLQRSIGLKQVNTELSKYQTLTSEYENADTNFTFACCCCHHVYTTNKIPTYNYN